MSPLLSLHVEKVRNPMTRWTPLAWTNDGRFSSHSMITSSVHFHLRMWQFQIDPIHWARELVFSQKDCEKTQFRLKIHTKFIKLCQTLSLLAEDNGSFRHAEICNQIFMFKSNLFTNF